MSCHPNLPVRQASLACRLRTIHVLLIHLIGVPTPLNVDADSHIFLGICEKCSKFAVFGRFLVVSRSSSFAAGLFGTGFQLAVDNIPHLLNNFGRLYAEVAELADAQDSKSCPVHPGCGFDSHLRQWPLLRAAQLLPAGRAKRGLCRRNRAKICAWRYLARSIMPRKAAENTANSAFGVLYTTPQSPGQLFFAQALARWSDS